jgi:hypothetical protein
VNVLRRLRAALAPGALLIDTQPVSPLPPVETNTQYLGALDRRAWARTIRSVDSQVARAIDEELFELIDTTHFDVTDEFGNGRQLVKATQRWHGTSAPQALVTRLARETRPVQLRQAVRLRVLRTR